MQLYFQSNHGTEVNIGELVPQCEGPFTTLVGSSQGLLCFQNDLTEKVTIWNPSIRKSIAIDVPSMREIYYDYTGIVSFGVCPLTLDPKIIMIPHYHKKHSTRHLSIVEVKVFSINLPRENMILEKSHVVIDGFIYHLASNYSKNGYVSNLMISFDLTSEAFREIHLPESIKLGRLSISKLKETLVVLEYDMVVASGMPLCAVWMMDNDSFTRLYTIKAPALSFNTILGFRKTGAIIFKRRIDNDNKRVLATYEPDSKQITDIGVFDGPCSFSLHSYMETLLLIDQPDCTIYKFD